MKKRNTLAIIQARMGSTRLHNKALSNIENKPMLWHVVARLKRSTKIDEVVVATSFNKRDEKIVNFCDKNEILVYRGSEENVLERYFLTAKNYYADTVLRVTADCPLIDPSVVDKAINKFNRGRFDYVAIATGAGVSKLNINRYPDGLDCEVFSFKTLKKAYGNARTVEEKEHATMFVWKQPNRFKIGHVFSKRDYSFYRFVVDYPSDLKFVRTIYGKLYKKNPNFLLKDIVELLSKNPGILKINSRHVGKEGYDKLWENINASTIKHELKSEFTKVKRPLSANLTKYKAVVVYCAEDVEVSNENKERIIQGVNLMKKISKSAIFIYLGSKYHNNSLKKYLNYKKHAFIVHFPVTRKHVSSYAQTKYLQSFLERSSLTNFIVVTHAYHVPRLNRYLVKYLDKKYNYIFWPVGRINKQLTSVDNEINKIIKYSAKGDLPLEINAK